MSTDMAGAETVAREQAPARSGADAERGSASAVTPTLSVIVCAYTMDRWGDLCAAIDSLRRQSHLPDEVVLVIDHCDELAARSRREFAGVRVVENTERQGLSGARNTGVRTARGEVVAFLDDDAAADRDWAEHLLAPYCDPDVLGVGGYVRPDWEDGRPGWFPQEFDWVVGCSYRGLPTRAAQVRNFIGANMSFRRDLLDRLGGFRHDLGRVGSRPLGCEETELCIRAAREYEGGLLHYAPAAAVRHHVPAGRGTWAYFRARCYAEGLSKAAVSELTGAGAALASERGYLGSTIPAGLLGPLRRGPDHTRWTTVLALVMGVAFTVAGYLVGRVGILAGRAGIALWPPAAGARPADRVVRAAALAGLPVALGLWIFALQRVHLSAISDLGLITALPTTFWAALATLTLGFAAAVYGRSRFSGTVPAGYVLGLIAILHATPALTYPVLRYSWAWKHVAIVDLMTAHGNLAHLPSSNPMAAYSQWPGFFALNSLIAQLTGAPSAGSYAAWAPPFFNALMIVPLLLLFRSITSRRRLVWTGIWVFFACSWVGQDYFAPQAYAFLLYVTFVAVLLRGLRALDRPGARLPHAEAALLLLIAATIDSSHQLTPLMLLTAVAALALRRAHRRALLPLLGCLTLMAVAWNGTVARPYLAANLDSLIAALGKLDANFGSGLVGLGAVNRDQVLIAWVDRALTAFVFALAVTALVRRPRLRRSPLGWLALSPGILGAASNYGGEMIFRVYLFSLPGLALLAAGLLLPPVRNRPVRRTLWTATRHAARRALLPAVSAAMLGGLVFGYYGKELANHFTSDEVTAARYLAAHAEPGELILAPNDNFPGAYLDYPDHPHIWFAEQNPGVARLVLADPIRELMTLSAGSPNLTSYVILTRSQAASAGQSGSLPVDAFTTIRTALEASPVSTEIFRNADTEIFRLSLMPAAPVQEGLS